MRFQTVCVYAVTLAAVALGGCNGQIGDTHSGTAGAGNSGSGGASINTGTGNGAGAGNASGTAGAGGSSMPAPGSLDLSGAPKYYRVVRLTNPQWASAV